MLFFCLTCLLVYYSVRSRQPFLISPSGEYPSLRSAGDAAEERAAFHGVGTELLPREISSGFYAGCSKSQKAVMAAVLRSDIGISYQAAAYICDVSVIYVKQAQKILENSSEDVRSNLKSGATTVNRELRSFARSSAEKDSYSPKS